MKSSRKAWVPALVIAAAGTGSLSGQVGTRVENWGVERSSSKAVDLSRPVSFVAVTPCRIVDTRDPAGPFGGPALPPATTRDFNLDFGPCTGIPPGIAAYSLNFTVTQTQGVGDLRVWPRGSTPPLVSTLNYVANQSVANAAVVPAGTNGDISVVVAGAGTHLIIDINGYFADRTNAGNAWNFGLVAPSIPALQVFNGSPGTVDTHGIEGSTFSGANGSYGVLGNNINATPADAGGVLGRVGGIAVGPFYGASGVRGENAGAFGVLGISVNGLGVAGSNLTGGAEQTWAALACSDSEAVCGMGTLSVTGSKSFVEPHPTDAAKVIKFVSLEGNEAGTYFRGRAKFDRGLARILVPEEFRMVTDAEGLSIQVTPIGEMASFAVVRIDLNEIVVKASRNVEFFYLVHGVRKGHADFDPIVEAPFFAPRSAAARMPGGLHDEARRKLIANGTYKADGTVNMDTAKRLGWTEKWKDAGVAAPEKD